MWARTEGVKFVQHSLKFYGNAAMLRFRSITVQERTSSVESLVYIVIYGTIHTKR